MQQSFKGSHYHQFKKPVVLIIPSEVPNHPLEPALDYELQVQL